RTGVGGDVFEPGRVGRGRRDDGRVLQRTGFFERAAHGGDRGALLPDRDVDAADLLVDVARFPVVLLVDDRVERDLGLPRLAVTDDELALPAAHGDHRVDRLEAGLQRLVHGLTVHHTRGLEFQGAAAGGFDVAEPVDRVAERIHDPAEVALADGDGEHFAGAADLLALFDSGELTQHHDTDFADVDVLGEA